MKIILGIISSYLLGSLPSAYLLGKFLKKIDIRDHGSGNVGATNALRVLGKLPGIFVLLFDAAKGIIAVTVLSHIFLSDFPGGKEKFTAIFGLSVVCGHVFNIFLRFNGGKGVATSTGVLLGIAPWSVFFGMIFFALIVGSTRYVALGSILASIIIPFYMLFTKHHYSYTILSACLCIIIAARHKSNIKRLLMGAERKIFEK